MEKERETTKRKKLVKQNGKEENTFCVYLDTHAEAGRFSFQDNVQEPRI
jgi:uncharacterized protein YbcV (DUF1398 family)